MSLVHANSLSATVDAVNDSFFFGRTLPATTRRTTAAWIASRQALPGAYGQLFAGFPSERASGIRLFTGERVTCASARHILGEESCRALLLLDSREGATVAALRRALDWIAARVDAAAVDTPRNNQGTFCCGKCTVGLWRNILAGGFDRPDERLRAGLVKLREQRKGDGEWRTFPFWYTVLALADIDRADARAELRYAARRLEAEARRPATSKPHAARRHALAERALQHL